MRRTREPSCLRPVGTPGWTSRLPWESEQWRFDFGYDQGDEVPMFYDPLIGKVVVHGGDRVNSLATFILDELHIEGIKTNIPALIDVVRNERFRSGEYDTGLLGK